MKKSRKVKILSKYSDSNYGENEIIDILPARHVRKIQSYLEHHRPKTIAVCSVCKTEVELAEYEKKPNHYTVQFRCNC